MYNIFSTTLSKILTVASAQFNIWLKTTQGRQPKLFSVITQVVKLWIGYILKIYCLHVLVVSQQMIFPP